MSALSSALVAAKFKALLDRLPPSPAMVARAAIHCGEIHVRLAKTFEVKRVTQIGSHWKGTAIRAYSDVDYLVVMSRDEARKWARDSSSTTIVTRIRTDLQARFPKTSVRRDGQAVVVAFEQGQLAVDVVPAIFGSFAKEPRYLIPDGAGGWTETSPEAQRTHLLVRNAMSGGKLVPLIRLIKCWAHARGSTDPFSSYYLETFLITLRIPVGITYSQALASIFRILYDTRCTNLEDPLGMSPSPIVPVSTRNQLEAVVESLAAATERARSAVAAETSGNHAEALRQWEIVFNRQFPA